MRKKTTADRIKELSRELARFTIPLEREIETGLEISRLVEAEPDNHDLDGWRDLLRMEAL